MFSSHTLSVVVKGERIKACWKKGRGALIQPCIIGKSAVCVEILAMRGANPSSNSTTRISKNCTALDRESCNKWGRYQAK